MNGGPPPLYPAKGPPPTCPACGLVNWYLGRVSAECAECGYALDLATPNRKGILAT